jgi:hypothetical protein
MSLQLSTRVSRVHSYRVDDDSLAKKIEKRRNQHQSLAQKLQAIGRTLPLGLFYPNVGKRSLQKSEVAVFSKRLATRCETKLQDAKKIYDAAEQQMKAEAKFRRQAKADYIKKIQEVYRG